MTRESGRRGHASPTRPRACDVSRDGSLTILDGSAFLTSDSKGDVDDALTRGFFHQDVRHLSRWELLVGGKPTEVLTSSCVDYFSARLVTIPADTVAPPGKLTIRRDRFVAHGFHEDLAVANHGIKPIELRLELFVGADFADIHECGGTIEKRGELRAEPGDAKLTLLYERDDYRRGTIVSFSEHCRVSKDRVVFELELAPREEWQTCIDVTALVGDEPREPVLRCDSFGKPDPDFPLSFRDWVSTAPTVAADARAIERAYSHGLAELAALRLRPSHDLEWALPAGGLPWFMTLFGRDTLLAAYEALPFRPELARSALEALADRQARERDDFSEAQPGKILHELRRGELAWFGDYPGHYYGSHDSTMLFLILLDEYERWTGDGPFVSELETPARRALEWLEGDADLDDDGYVEYVQRSKVGLKNHCWKDSDDSIRFRDGRVAKPPIATCEQQGYAYDARLRTARLARELWNDQALAERLEADARELKERFNRDFWLDDRGYFALALDGEKRQVDAAASNMGHLLWSGIVDDEKAAAVVRRLFRDELWTGWGIRTLSTDVQGYGPLEYHNGTVWPHDCAIVAEGLRRYGFRAEAARVALAVFDAAAAFDFRLPELFAGIPRDETDLPIEYPHANRPQAFAAGAPLLALRTLLGLDVEDGRLAFELRAPEDVGEIRVSGLPVRGSRVDVVMRAADEDEREPRAAPQQDAA